jgi:hypothetical protein
LGATGGNLVIADIGAALSSSSSAVKRTGKYILMFIYLFITIF